jgi:dCMP deaminase
VSKRSTCNRLNVGAILVKNKLILGSGYNGSSRDLDHCEDNNHLMKDGDTHCKNVIHAEINCIAMAARQGISIDDCSIYVTHFPCWECFKVLINCGIKEVYYLNDYKNSEHVNDAAKKLDIKIEKVEC